ncbi:MAG: GDP-mannose 4,6-dehydratase, partial [Bacteroidota bacterium]
CSNNYGPYQFPEKLLPLMINNIQQEKPLPIYGDGKYTRDWLWVEDHVSAIDCIFHKGELGETYNIGGNNEWQNLDLVHLLCEVMDELLGREPGSAKELITFVTDRPGHDRRYAIDATKIKEKLGWEPTMKMDEGLRKTASWYLENKAWMDNITSGSYQQYYEKQYGSRV